MRINNVEGKKISVNELFNSNDMNNKLENIISSKKNKDNNKVLNLLLSKASSVRISIDGQKLNELKRSLGPGHDELENFANQDKEVAAKHHTLYGLESQLKNDKGELSSGDKLNIQGQIHAINKWLDENSPADHLKNSIAELNDFLSKNNVDITQFQDDDNTIMINTLGSLTSKVTQAYSDYDNAVKEQTEKSIQQKTAQSYQTIKQLSYETSRYQLSNASEQIAKKSITETTASDNKQSLAQAKDNLAIILSDANEKLGRRKEKNTDIGQKKFYEELDAKMSNVEDAEREYGIESGKRNKARQKAQKENIDKIYDDIKDSMESPYKITLTGIKLSSAQRAAGAENIIDTKKAKKILATLTDKTEDPDRQEITDKQESNDGEQDISVDITDKVIRQLAGEKAYAEICQKDKEINTKNHLYL